MAAKVGQGAALHLHVTELLMLLGNAVLMAVEPPLQRAPAQPQAAQGSESYTFSSPSS